MKRQLKTTLLLLVFAVSQGALAKTLENDTSINYRYTVSTGPSAVFPLSGDSDRSSSWGADFMYRFSPKWEVGVQLDFSFLKGFEDFEGFTVVPVAAYSVTGYLNAFIGAGVEHSKESGENEFLARLGGEYAIYLNKEQSFMLLPGGFVDFVGGESSASVVLSVGYAF